MEKKQILMICLYVILIGAPIGLFIYLFVSNMPQTMIGNDSTGQIGQISNYSTMDYFDLYRLLKLTIGNFCFNSICKQQVKNRARKQNISCQDSYFKNTPNSIVQISSSANPILLEKFALKPTINKRLVSNQKLFSKLANLYENDREHFSFSDPKPEQLYSYDFPDGNGQVGIPVYQLSGERSQVIAYDKTTNSCRYDKVCNTQKYTFLNKQLYKNLRKFPVICSMLSEYPRSGMNDQEVLDEIVDKMQDSTSEYKNQLNLVIYDYGTTDLSKVATKNQADKIFIQFMSWAINYIQWFETKMHPLEANTYYRNYFDNKQYAFMDGMFKDDPNGIDFGVYDGSSFDQAIKVEPVPPMFYWEKAPAADTVPTADTAPAADTSSVQSSENKTKE